jgi:hypothetical protein
MSTIEMEHQDSDETMNIIVRDASPEIKSRVIDLKERKLSSQERHEDKVWTSCCFRCDKGMVVYISHTTILASMMVYSAGMLSMSDTCESQNIWQSLLTMCIGLLIPAPKMND